MTRIESSFNWCNPRGRAALMKSWSGAVLALVLCGESMVHGQGLVAPPRGAAVVTPNVVAVPHGAASAPHGLAPDSHRPRLFLACPLKCFDDYVRQQLNYFDFVRDPHAADLTIIVVRQRAGNGGERFTVTLAHAVRMNSKPDDVSQSFSAAFGQTATVTRHQLVQVILRMLQVELANTPDAAAFELRLPNRDAQTLSTLDDPWNYWVFAPEIKAGANGGSGFNFIETTGALTVRRITEESKVRLHGSYNRKWSRFRLEDGSNITGDVSAIRGRALYAYSVGERWALGPVVSSLTEQYSNYQLHLHGGPLVEFNVFPYAENASQQLRFAYQAGVWANWYLEPNRDGKLKEWYPYHALSVIADANQYWGSLQWVGQVNSFVTQPELFRLSTGAIVSLRLFEGFSVGLQGKAAWVNDQINLRQRQITDNEIVLWSAEQATQYIFEAELVLTYTFGSAHNTIVNPRFARVDLDEE